MIRRIAITAAGTAFTAVLLLAAKPHHTVSVLSRQASSTSGASVSGSAVGVHTATGGTVQTVWGPVQVEVTFLGTKLTGVRVLQQPDGTFNDVEINGFALPILTKETLAAQNAHIDAVSGATYTSQGYVGSLQSALDAAGR